MRGEPVDSRAPEAARSERNGKDRPPAEAGAAERFRALMHGASQEQGRPATAQLGPDDHRQQDLAQNLTAAELASQRAMPAAADPAGSAATTQAPAAAGALARMLEEHVRRMLVDEAARTGQGGRVMLSLAGTPLAGTDLWLTRSAEGWSLQAQTASADAAALIEQAAPELKARFRARDLGELSLELPDRPR